MAHLLSRIGAFSHRRRLAVVLVWLAVARPSMPASAEVVEDRSRKPVAMVMPRTPTPTPTTAVTIVPAERRASFGLSGDADGQPAEPSR
jgi:hypothetical protein